MGVREIISGMDPDLLVQEVMYGSIMALTFVITAQFDVLAYNDRTELAIAIIAMDFVWAVIDLLLFYRSDLVGMARRAKLSRKLHSGDDRGELRADIEAEFEGTFLDMTDDETRREVIDKIMMSGPPDNPHNLAVLARGGTARAPSALSSLRYSPHSLHQSASLSYPTTIPPCSRPACR